MYGIDGECGDGSESNESGRIVLLATVPFGSINGGDSVQVGGGGGGWPKRWPRFNDANNRRKSALKQRQMEIRLRMKNSTQSTFTIQ